MEFILIMIGVVFVVLIKKVLSKRQIKNKYRIDFYDAVGQKNELTVKEVDRYNIELNIYSSNYFSSHNIRESYEKFVIHLEMVKEPFITDFFKIMKYIDINNFWIKSPKSREIIMNIRDHNLQKSVHKSFLFLDIKDVISDMLTRLLPYMNSNKKSEILLLSSMIYVLSKSNNIQVTSENFENENEISIYLIDELIDGYSASGLMPINNSKYPLIKQIYEEIIKNSVEYENVIELSDTKLTNSKSLSYMPKKEIHTFEIYR